MGLRLIRNLVTDARCEDEFTTVRKLRLQLAVQAQEYVTLFAPVIGSIVRRILNHPDTNLAKLLRPPKGYPRLAAVSRGLDFRPIGDAKGNVRNTHSLD